MLVTLSPYNMIFNLLATGYNTYYINFKLTAILLYARYFQIHNNIALHKYKKDYIIG